MKNIKFKIWDKENNKFVSGYESFNDVCGSENDETGNHIVLRQDKYIPLQFTGLLDRSGKEIYEGDMLTATNKFGTEMIGEVYFDEGMFKVKQGYSYPKVDQRTDYFSSGHLDNALVWEIIGNIYENPELIKTL